MAQTPRSIQVRVDIENMPEVKARVEAMIAEATDSLLAERDALAEQVKRVRALVEEWRYKGEFGWGPWQIGEGPDPEGQVLDECAAALRAALAAPSDPATDTGGEGQQ